MTVGPMTTAVFRVSLPASSSGPTEAPLVLDLQHTHLRGTIYHQQRGSTDCHGQGDRLSTIAATSAANTENYYAVVSNVSFADEGGFTLSFPGLNILSPAAGTTVDEGAPLTFSAETTGGEDARVTWSRYRDGTTTPFVMGTTTGNETISTALCDGTYRITARAMVGGFPVSRSVRLNVRDLGNTDPPDGCAPQVSITRPIENDVVPLNAEVDLQAETSVRGGGFSAYPVIWRLDGPDGVELAWGADTNATFTTPGEVTLHVSYGVASDSIKLTAVPGEPPVATILTPENGAWFYWYDEQDPTDPDGYTVTFTGEAESGGIPLSGPALTWRVRTHGTWSGVIGEGNHITHRFGYSGTAQTQPWDVLLSATDPASGLTGYSLITVVVARPPN